MKLSPISIVGLVAILAAAGTTEAANLRAPKGLVAEEKKETLADIYNTADEGRGLGRSKPLSSDRRQKRKIHFVGNSASGIRVYTFKFKHGVEGVDSHATYSGVMAQDLLDDHPEAVELGSDGFYNVDYSLIDVKFQKLT